MPTPIYRFRLGKPEQAALVEMSKVYGAPTPSAFIREMVMSMCSPDLSKANAFLGRLMEKVTGQMPLPLQVEARSQLSPAQEAVYALAVKNKPKSPKVRGKGAKRDKRPS